MKAFKTILAIALVLMMGFSLPSQAAQTTEAPSEFPQAPKEFEFLEAESKDIEEYYTAIRIPGFDHPVYAYTDKSGATAYFVYGRLNEKKGLFEAQLSAQKEGDAYAFDLHIFGDHPHRVRFEDLGRPKAVKLSSATLPQGYKKTSKPGMCYFINIFQQKEYRALGRIEGRPDAFYFPSYGKPRAGSLVVDIAQDQERFKPDIGKYLKLPKEYKSGYATGVLVLTTQAEWVGVMTDKPLLNLSLPE